MKAVLSGKILSILRSAIRDISPSFLHRTSDTDLPLSADTAADTAEVADTAAAADTAEVADIAAAVDTADLAFPDFEHCLHFLECYFPFYLSFPWNYYRTYLHCL